jgi:hypothetical protein
VAYKHTLSVSHLLLSAVMLNILAPKSGLVFTKLLAIIIYLLIKSDRKKLCEYHLIFSTLFLLFYFNLFSNSFLFHQFNFLLFWSGTPQLSHTVAATQAQKEYVQSLGKTTSLFDYFL